MDRQRIRHLPIKLRMTLAFGSATAGLFAAVGIGLYLTVAAALLDEIDSGLQVRAATLQAEAATRLVPAVSLDPALTEPGEALTQTLSTDGALLQPGLPAGAGPVLSADEVAGLRGPTAVERRVPGMANVTRLLAVPVQAPGRRVVVVVGTSMQDRADTLHLLTGFLAVAEPLALLAACVVGWRVAGSALGPVDAMRRQAAAVAVSGLDRRLGVPAGEDEIARLARTLNDMLDRLERSFRAERRFLDTASHELRTPLATLRMELDLALARPRGPDELRAALVSASQEADRLARLAEDLLVLSRADQGRLPLHRTETSLHELVDGTAGRWRARAAAAGVRLSADAEEVTVRADPMRLHQALDNLVDNALRHSPAGGLLEVRAYSDGGTAWIVVADEGPGFPDGGFPDGAGVPPGAGADLPPGGLGLAIVRAVTEAHGGTVHLRHRPEGGAQVALALPLRPDQRDPPTALR